MFDVRKELSKALVVGLSEIFPVGLSINLRPKKLQRHRRLQHHLDLLFLLQFVLLLSLCWGGRQAVTLLVASFRKTPLKQTYLVRRRVMSSWREETPEVAGLLAIPILCSAFFLVFHSSAEGDGFLNTLLEITEFLSGWKVGGGVEGGMLSVHVLDFMGSLLCCRTYRLNAEGDKHWLESLLSCAVMQFGGTTLTGLVLGQPGSWMLGPSLSSPLALLLAWWLVFCAPADVFFRGMNILSVRGGGKAEGGGEGGGEGGLWRVPELLSAVSSGHAVTTWGVDKVW